MSGINTTTRMSSLLEQAHSGMKKAIKEGTLQVGRIQVINASPEVKAQVEQSYQNSVRALEQRKADYRTAIAKTTIDLENNSASLPDVATLSKEQAKSMLSGLRQMDYVGDLDGKTLSASNGNQKTGNLTTYMQWLQARVGIDVYA
ncbi:hypothetical protein [Pseudomonas turukhanskensis]|uniref:Uncharacterized protein n=1 Tax=Pseudomonas turukhanskensis TaxID=1806536 RepID=A0A9W6K7V7_9PSED|nr:hypothetical protein [Pseudomonas turukhanskensis]GLK90422.1 hypothetical protein GCM10017655_34850 [Pseudomonas turukhanskensis]